MSKDIEPTNLTSKEVKDEVVSTAKAVVRTTLVWTFASLATGFLRDLIKSTVSKK